VADGVFNTLHMHSSATQIIDLYERHARAWDEARGRSLFERPWLERFCAAMEAGRSVLDIGCGAGEPIARFFVGAGYRVTGVDASPSLIQVSTGRFPDHTWMVRDMRSLDLGVRFDGIIAWDSFFHLSHDDQRAMFPIFRTHAAPGAALMFTSGPSHGEAIGSFEGDVLYHASLAPDEYERLLAENGFGVVAHIAEDPDCGGHTVWLARAAV
jgi:SAM-dependent methyltransferase